MVVTTKLRITVEMCGLKEASYRLTHPGAPPLLNAQSVQENTYKMLTDAWTGFCMIPVHPDSRRYTIFVTEQGYVLQLKDALGRVNLYGHIQLQV